MRDFSLALPKLIYGVAAMSLRARRSSRPGRRLHGTARENAAVFRDMSEFDPLAWSRENYFVIADDRAAAQRRKADIANRAQAGVAVTHADGMVFEGNPTAFRGASAEQKRGPGGCIDLHAMMHLEDLDIIFGTQRAGGL